MTSLSHTRSIDVDWLSMYILYDFEKKRQLGRCSIGLHLFFGELHQGVVVGLPRQAAVGNGAAEPE